MWALVSISIKFSESGFLQGLFLFKSNFMKDHLQRLADEIYKSAQKAEIPPGFLMEMAVNEHNRRQRHQRLRAIVIISMMGSGAACCTCIYLLTALSK